MRKIVIYSIITLLSVVSVFLANYAMVFPLASRMVSLFALSISSLQFLIVLFHPHAWHQKEKYFLGMWAGPLLFSMNKWISPVSILMLICVHPVLLKWIKKHEMRAEEPSGFLVKWKYASSELLWISISYFFLHVCREYTVWHEFHFQFLPTLFLFIISLNWIIFQKSEK